MSVFKHQITASMAKDIAFKLGVELNNEEAEIFADGYNTALLQAGNSPAEIEQLREKLKQAEEKNLRLLGFVDSYDWQRQRLHQAAEKVIAWNRQEAKDQYGDANKAETYACVRELRDAIKFCEQKETSND
ncbi:hypothetical protein XS16_005251 [Salmonella enterica subsp. enterica serovar Newport]|nr:hypothetical protein [Salmonella enterica subsp. enterica serovar Newport]